MIQAPNTAEPLDPLQANLENSHFNGNVLLRPADVPMSMTEEQMAEYLRCSEDPVYFASRYIKIVTLDEGLVQFEPYDYQKNSITTFQNNRFVVVNQPRQSGKTTGVASFAIWEILFHSNHVTAILANKMDTAQGILDRIATAYENIPKWMQQGVTVWNKRSIALENGSKLFVAATSASAIRSSSVNTLILDEFAHMDGNLQTKFFESTYPVITAGTKTKIIMISTPNGMELFFKIWHGAIHKLNDYVPIEIHWWDTPGRDEAWKKKTIARTSQAQFDQEFGGRFMGSAGTLIDADTLEKLTYIKPIRKMREYSDIKVFKEPEKDHLYMIVADTARGVAGDYSAFVVVDVTDTPYEVVCSYHDNTIKPELFARVLDHAGQVYNSAMVLPEDNDLGAQVISIMFNELEYENMMLTSTRGKEGQILGTGGSPASVRMGVKTSPAVKRRGCFGLKNMIETEALIINSEDIVNELYVFIKNNKGSWSAQEGEGHHDDLTMCLVLFAWATTQEYFREMIANGKTAWDHEKDKNNAGDQMLVFGFINDPATEDTEKDRQHGLIEGLLVTGEGDPDGNDWWANTFMQDGGNW